MLRAGPARKRARGPSPALGNAPGRQALRTPTLQGGGPARGARRTGTGWVWKCWSPALYGGGAAPPPRRGGSKVVAPPAGGDLSTICSKDCMLGATLLKYDTIMNIDTMHGALRFGISR